MSSTCLHTHKEVANDTGMTCDVNSVLFLGSKPIWQAAYMQQTLSTGPFGDKQAMALG